MVRIRKNYDPQLRWKTWSEGPPFLSDSPLPQAPDSTPAVIMGVKVSKLTRTPISMYFSEVTSPSHFLQAANDRLSGVKTCN